MRIGIDARALMEGKITGVEVYLTNLLNALFEADKENEYVLFANSYGAVKLPEFNFPKVKTVHTKYPNKFFNLAQKFLRYPKIDRLLGGVDLFFSPHWRETALSVSVPLVVTFHDLFYEFMPEFFTLKRRLWHRFMNYRGAAEKAEKIIAVSESTKRDLMNIYGVPEDKIRVVYSGVNGGNKGNNAPGDYFLSVGTFEPRKNIQGLVAAYEEYHARGGRKKLILAGQTGWKTVFEIPKELENMIEIRKNINEREKTALYQNAFALVFPSFYEGFGFPVLEAGAAGAPVIASYNSSLAEIGKDFALFVNPLRPSSAAGAMLNLEKDARLYKSLREKGLAATEKFNWTQTAESTLRLFKSVI